MAGCETTPSGDGSVAVTEVDGNKFTVCDFRSVKDTVTLNLSDLVTDFQIVRFENKDDAYFGPTMPTITDQYIGVRQQSRPLFIGKLKAAK